jgi:putative transposase
MRIPQDPRDLTCLRVRIPAPAGWEILKTNGTGRAPRRTGWGRPQFPRSPADSILACDFFSASLPGGTQAYALAVIKHAARRIRIPASGCLLPGNGSASGPAT